MPAILYTILKWVIVSAFARVLAGLVISTVAMTWLGDYANDALGYAVSSISALPAGVGQIVLMTGIGQVISIIGSALITRAVIVSSANTFGIGLGSSS